MIWHLYIAWGGYRFGTRAQYSAAREEPCCCGLATDAAEVGRAPHIVASQRRGANGTVTLLGGILT